MRSGPRNNMGVVFSGRGPCRDYIAKSKRMLHKEYCRQTSVEKIFGRGSLGV
jgi:exosome complex RNA-binding protein Csl4